jgi:hypothetical protein
MSDDFIFLYWDDLGDSQQHVDNQNKPANPDNSLQNEETDTTNS